jgi:hypothetical protein
MKKTLVLFHSLGLSVLGSSLVWTFITFIDILTNNSITFIEPNPLILSFEICLTAYGILYLGYLYSKIPKLLKQTKNTERPLTFWQKVQLKLTGRAFLRWEKREGWTDYLPIYLVKCNKHGYFEDYSHGHREYFICPKCEEERKEKWT